MLGDIYQKRIPFFSNSTYEVGNEFVEGLRFMKINSRYNYSDYDPVEFDFSNGSDGRSLLMPASSDERYCSVVSSCKIYCRCMDLDGLSFEIDSYLEV